MTQIQFITHYTERHSYLEGAMMALEGGCSWIQLRMKDAADEDIIATARKLRPICSEYKATFVIDDHVDIARLVHADGVHLGKNDMPVAEARRLLGTDYIIGGTANTFKDVEALYRDGADYIGCGPYRFTTTKKNLSPILGLCGYQQIVADMHRAEIDIPIVAIGGIKYEDIEPIMQTGVNGMAVSGSILSADDPVGEMARWCGK